MARGRTSPLIVINDQEDLVRALVARCEERKIATSSTDKLPGVTQPWLHNLKTGRQKTIELAKMFPLVRALGYELHLVLKQPAKRNDTTKELIAQSREKRALTLSKAERQEISEIMSSAQMPVDYINEIPLAAE